MTHTVDILGDGSEENPYRADYDGVYRTVAYDHDNGAVEIEQLDQ